MNKFASKIFIDGGVADETRQAKDLLGYLSGQTTNPTLIAKNLAASMGGKKLSEEEALGQYKKIVQEINNIIPDGSISIQVFANRETKSDEMLVQARARNKWIPNASIKFPCIKEGLKAASQACREMPINITLAFSQAQATAVYEATKEAKFPVFISPFVGRLDDKGENGMDVVKNIIEMYRDLDHRVEVLTASIRNIDHILYALQLSSNIITIPFKVFKSWGEGGFREPEKEYQYPSSNLKPIPYDETIKLGRNWQEYDLSHPLTEAGVQRFWDDWMGVVQQ